MQKWGKDARGKQRFRCKNCCKTAQKNRFDVTLKSRQKLFLKWLLGKFSLIELAQKHNVTRQTLNTWFQPFWDEEPLPQIQNIAGQVLIIDGKYIEKDAVILLGTTHKKVVSWHFSQRENFSSWTTFLSSLKHIPFAIVCDGQKGMLKAIRQIFTRVIIQRCQFHVIKYCLTKLTKNPEYEAAWEFRELVLQVSQIKTREQLKVWLADYKYWYQTHKDFLKEKTYYHDQLTPTGRRKWSYTHGKLHAAYSHLKNSIPNLFCYLDHPQIPNTTNFVEGGINSPMQEKLRFHRGLKLPKRRILIAHFLSSKQ